MERTIPRRPALAALLPALVLCGCSGGADLDRIAEQGRFVANFDGREVPLAIEVLDVYLVDPDWEEEYPETFVLIGDDLELVGRFPMNLRVGYAGDFDSMVGREVAIEARAEIAGRPKRSRLKMDGLGGAVSGGTLQVDRVLGDNPAGAGQIVEGQLILRMNDDRTVRGRFQVAAQTWG